MEDFKSIRRGDAQTFISAGTFMKICLPKYTIGLSDMDSLQPKENLANNSWYIIKGISQNMRRLVIRDDYLKTLLRSRFQIPLSVALLFGSYN